MTPFESEVLRRQLVHKITGRRILSVTGFVLAMPAALLGYWVTGREWGAIVGAFACASAGIISGLSLVLMQCPQCRNLLFLRNTGWMNTLASRCANCGLSLSSWPEGQGSRPREPPDNNELQRTRPAQAMEPRR